MPQPAEFVPPPVALRHIDPVTSGLGGLAPAGVVFLMLRKATLGLALAGLIAACPAAAQQFSQTTNGGLFSVFDEVRTGGSFSIQPNDHSGLIIRGEVITKPFVVHEFHNYFANTFLRPRIDIGGNLATANNGVSQVFAAFNWHFPVFDPFFVEATFGFTVHNGPLESPGDGLDLGCNLLFRESVGVGADVGQHWRVVVAADHSSHAHLICNGGNSGITHLGGYIGYRF